MGGVFAPDSASLIVRKGGESTGMANALRVSVAGNPQIFVGRSGFALAGLTNFDLALFVRESAIVAAFVAILAGALAERMKFSAFLSLALFCGAAIHPVNAAACWGGGWLAALGRNFGLGHGVVDPGGAIYLHLSVAAVGMAGIFFLGPRYGKYNRDGSPNPIPGHNASNVLVGTSLLLVGWLGLAAGSALLVAQGPAAAMCAVLVGGGGGMISGYLISFVLLKKPDPFLLCSATIGGWVSGSASWGILPVWAFAALGFLAGALVILALLIIERRLKIDEPTGVLAVHGVAGLIGGLAPGFFAQGGAGVGSGGTVGPVTGLAYGDSGQLLAQGAGILATFLTISILSSICLLCIRLVIGLRADLRDEVAGLDLPELGALGYQPDLNPEPKLRKKK
jgi:Amt family ammonium transporter